MIAASMPVPDFQGNLPKSNPVEQKHENIIGPGRENTKRSTKYWCYLHKKRLVLVSQCDNVCLQ